MKIINPTNRLKILLAIVFIICIGSTKLHAQYSINGPSPVNQGQTYQYYVSGGGYNSISWQVYYGGSIVGSQYDSTVSVLWTVGTSGTVGATVTDYYYNPYYLSKNVTINPTTPSAPPPPTVQDMNCGNTVLTRPNPPSGSGITYYWQDNASGTSTSNSSSTITKYTSGTQYLRARNGGGTWSTSSSSVSYTVNQVPSEPTGQGNYRCSGPGPVYIMAIPGSGADNIRWYSALTGGTLLHTGTSYLTPSISSTTTYYAQSYDDETGCVSPGRVAVVATVYPSLSAGTINSKAPICYNTNVGLLSATEASGGDEDYAYQWQYSNNGSSGWTNISGATASTYTEGTITASRWYRRQVVSCSETKYTNSIEVTVYSSLDPGAIQGLASPICYNEDPSALNNSILPSGGNSIYSYQWQVSSDGNSWSNISGASAENYNPGPLTSDRWYRRRVSSCGEIKYTTSVKITVRPSLSAGAIAVTETQPICYNGNPSALVNSSSPSGGDSNNYSYQWQVSSNGSTWSNISGATSVTYDPGALTSDKWYRRRVSSCGETKYTTSVKITVYPTLNPGTITGIAEPICYNEDPSALVNSSSPSGGNPTYYGYQWQVSSNGSSWTNISGATGITYDPGALTSDRWYRRRVFSCGEYKYTTSVKITVRPSLSAGAIQGLASPICYNEDPSALNNSILPSGGDSNNYSYQWQYSNNGSSGWTNISGATGITYDPGALTSDRWYRRRVSSCGETKYTSSVQITVRPSLSAGSITGLASPICYNEDPSALGNSSSPSGGDPTNYSYQWQYSNNGSSGWTNISGATAITYDPGALTSDRWYRRSVSSCGETKYTTSVKITVWPNLDPGAINGTDTICSGSDAGTLGNATSPTGGDSNYSYQWQYSNNGSSGWTNISGATSSTYAPGTLTATRWYRRQVVSCSQTTYSASVKITITSIQTWYADTDSDGYGDPSSTTTACTAPVGYVSNGDDYDDTTSNITNIAPQYFYRDADGDTFGDSNDSKFYSVKPVGYVSNDDDFDDTTVNITNIAPQYFYNDTDGDGFGDPNDYVYYSVMPAGYVLDNTDACPTEYEPTTGCPSCEGLSDENYVYTRAYQVPLGTSPSGISTNGDIIENVTYFDGLGRPMQSVAIRQGGQEGDIITHFTYDQFGRQAKDFLPFVDIDCIASYRSNDPEQQTIDYNMAKYPLDLNEIVETNPFSKKDFEASPLNRVMRQAAPGDAWKLDSGREIKFDYKSNITDEVRLFNVVFDNNDTSEPILEDTGTYYTSGALYKTVTKDENWDAGQTNPKDHTTEEFKDKQGRVVLKRTYGESVVDGVTVASAEHNTYYVYDDFGNLTFVIPPLAEPKITEVFSAPSSYNTSTVNINTGQEFNNKNNAPVNVTAVDLGNNVYELQFAIPTAFTFQGQNKMTTGHVTNLPSEYAFLTAEDFWTITNGSDQYVFSIINGEVHIELIGSAFTNNLVGSATIVLPSPGANTYTTNANTLDDLCYIYKYDDRNRLVEKKIPGKGWEFIIYDKLDRPVLTQDSEQRLSKEWLFTKYDVFGRVIYTGMFTNADTEPDDRIRRDNLQAMFDDPSLTAGDMYETKLASSVSNLNIEYTNNNFPGSSENLMVLTVNYYDDYNFDKDELVVPTQVVLNGNTTQVTTDTKGLATGSKVRVLSATENWTTTVTGYDAKARPIYVATMNQYLGTTDIIKSELDFVGRVAVTESSHQKDLAQPIVTRDDFLYDNAGRLLTQVQTINGQTADAELIVENHYDDIGQLESKGVGHLASSSTRLQDIDYSYNIRGWLTGINNESNNNAAITLGVGVPGEADDLFGFQINYNNPSGGSALFNGNISQTLWKTTSVNNTSNPVSNTYAYTYDALNRIKSATDNTGNYNLTSIAYDMNGNIQSLQRQGMNEATLALGAMDNLSYYYNGNQLHSVTDLVTNTSGFNDGNLSDAIFNNSDDDYSYDSNGNMKYDKNKGIGNIEYNYLNLPETVTIASNKYIQYIYDATGVKLQKLVKDGNGGSSETITQYAGNYVYQGGSLKFFNQPEGYVEPDGSGGYDYVYQYKDHLGNIRLSYTDINGDGFITSATEILEENNYYPFGLRHKGYNNVINGTDHPYGYLNQEEQNELGLNWLTFRYRNYMPDIGRFFGSDPISEDFYSISNYQFAHNNPIWKIELEGLEGQELTGIDVVNREPVTYTTEMNGKAVTFQTRRVYVRDYTVTITGNGRYSAFDNGGSYQARVKSSDAGSNNWYGDTEYNYTVYEQGANEPITISTQSEKSTTVPGLINEKYNPIDENKARALEGTGKSLENIGENGVVAATVAKTPIGIGLTQATSLTGSFLQAIADAERSNTGDIAKKAVTETVLEVGGNVVERQVQNKTKSNWIMGAYEFLSNLIDNKIND